MYRLVVAAEPETLLSSAEMGAEHSLLTLGSWRTFLTITG
jgi:hypothetical protein